MLAATLLREEFAEAADLTKRLRGVVAQGAPLLPSVARYAGALTTLAFDEVTLQIVRAPPMLFLGAAEDGRVGLVQTLAGTARARWNGRPIAPNKVAVFADGRRHRHLPGRVRMRRPERRRRRPRRCGGGSVAFGGGSGGATWCPAGHRAG